VTTLTTKDLEAYKKAARDALWRKGDLQWKLDNGLSSGPQRDIYFASASSKSKTFITEAARRLGKTYVHALIAVELALKNPGRRINWCQDSAKAVRDAAIPLFEKVCADAPDDCKGVFKSQRGTFEFPNGAYIFCFGGDSQEDADRARGGDDPIANFVDEAGFTSLLEYIYKSILKPGTLRILRNGHFGMNFLVSSTPRVPTHYFCKIADSKQRSSGYIKRTIYDTAYADQYIREEAEDEGISIEEFVASNTFRREFMCSREVDSASVIFPEFHRHHTTVIRAVNRPVGFLKYVQKRVSIDLGVTDPTGVLFGYMDFQNARIVVERELMLHKPNNSNTDIVREVSAVEREIWSDPVFSANTIIPHLDRIVDDSMGRTIQDFNTLFKFRTRCAVKPNRDASINLIRDYIQSGKLVIDPSCTNLIEQLFTAEPTNNGKDFKRIDGHHFDLVAALMYFVRDWSFTYNPYPADFNTVLDRELPEQSPIRIRAMYEPKPISGLEQALAPRRR
jgi:hypothetical protein